MCSPQKRSLWISTVFHFNLIRWGIFSLAWISSIHLKFIIGELVVCGLILQKLHLRPHTWNRISTIFYLRSSWKNAWHFVLISLSFYVFNWFEVLGFQIWSGLKPHFLFCYGFQKILKFTILVVKFVYQS